MTGVKLVSSVSEWDSIVQATTGINGKPVLVDFYASWCGPCKLIAPLLESFSSQFINITFVKIDVDQLQSIAQQNDVKAMPTIIGIHNGRTVGEVIGANQAAILSLIKKLNEEASNVMKGNSYVLGHGNTSSDVGSNLSMREKMAAAAEARLKNKITDNSA